MTSGLGTEAGGEGDGGGAAGVTRASGGTLTSGLGTEGGSTEGSGEAAGATGASGAGDDGEAAGLAEVNCFPWISTGEPTATISDPTIGSA